MDHSDQHYWLNPANLSEALSMLYTRQEEKVLVLAGATDILPKMRAGCLSARYLVDIWQLNELKKIKEEESYISIGSMATMTSLIHNPLVAKYAPALVTAASALGSPQIRNRATIGGNLCNASPAADLSPVLIVLEARVLLRSSMTSREVSVEELFTGPGKTVINEAEILTSIFIPKKKMHTGFVKLGKRNALTCAIVNCAMAGQLKEGRVSDLRITLGSVAPTPLRVHDVEKALEGFELVDAVARGEELIKAAVHPIDDTRGTADYRRQMSGVLFRRLFNHVFLKKPLGGVIQ